LKKQAKAEKAARRQQALAEKQSGAPQVTIAAVPGPQQKLEVPKAVKGQQKRRPSTSTDAKSLPLRGVLAVPAIPAAPKKEDKTVEFFRHLYKQRTTTIAGASREVHPAVLALGLQMSNYIICGSCARLVATLQAFKRVSVALGYQSLAMAY
jgi:translation initiation factor eIF-2B subunit delta